MNYAETIQFLYDLRFFGAKFGLENTRRLAALSGNPQEKLRFIHVAGTNGKGSVCATLESVYRTSGLRVGLFTSPHLVHFGERIQVDRRPIPEAEVVRLVNEMRPLLAQFSKDHHPTFFEVVAVLALRYFAEQKCDLVIWETGLGGRLDATNIVAPLASVITNIQFDHEKWLGNTLASIASEKAGIIKPDVPVIAGVEDPEALEVIRRAAMAANAPLQEARVAGSPMLSQIRLSLRGEHQKKNAAVSLRTIEMLQPVLPVSADTIVRGMENVFWPGRLQRIERANGQVVLLDAAHNPGGAETLAQAIRADFPGRQVCFILGILADKNYREMCRILAPLAQKILIVPVHSERAATASELAAACRDANPGAEVLPCDSLPQALASSAREEVVVIAGSLYLAGEAMEQLGIVAMDREQERHLNEWGTRSVSGRID